MHVRSEHRSPQGHPELYFDLKMQANKHFGHLSVSLNDLKYLVAVIPLFSFISSLPLSCILVISFPVPNLIPPHSVASQLVVAPHTWLSAFTKRFSCVSIPAVHFPAFSLPFSLQQLTFTHPWVTNRCAAAERDLQMCWFYCFLLSHSPTTLATTQWKVGKLRTVLWAAMNRICVSRYFMQ